MPDHTFHFLFRNSWCDPFKTWQRVGHVQFVFVHSSRLIARQAYSFDPYANLTVDQRSLVLGGLSDNPQIQLRMPSSPRFVSGQMPLWSEQSSPENLDSIVWPRLAAAAEVFWTGARLPDGLPRLGEHQRSLCDMFRLSWLTMYRRKRDKRDASTSPFERASI